MSTYYVIYHGLIFLALLLSCIAYQKGVKRALYLLLLLFATLAVELLCEFLPHYHIKHFIWIYHVFNPLEYLLFSLYYIKACSTGLLKNAVRYSIPIYAVVGSFVSFYVYRYTSMPSININIEGFILFIIYTHLLFSIDVNLNIFIYRHPDFWIAIGVLIFFGGVAVYAGLYPLLLHLDFEQTMNLFDAITKPLNLVFYICFNIGLLCLIQNKKYFTA